MFGRTKKLSVVCGGTDSNNRSVRQVKDIESKVDLDSLKKAAAGPIAELVEATHVHYGYIHVMDGGKKIASLTIDAGSYQSLTLTG